MRAAVSFSFSLSLVLVAFACGSQQPSLAPLGAPVAPASLLSATCAGERCPHERPLCQVSAGLSRCVAASARAAQQHDGKVGLFACTRPSDCRSGQRCCTNPLWDASHCAAECDAANTGFLCGEDADCEASNAGPSVCRPAPAEDAPALPVWIGVCAARTP